MMASGMATDFADSRVIFVYNAQSGIFDALSDYMHKIVSPDTYACQLCAITYGNLGMHSSWAVYVKALPAKVIFTYKDKLTTEPPVMRNAELPAAFVTRDGETKLAITAKEFNACQSEEELIALCGKELESLLI